jgi:regulatory protein
VPLRGYRYATTQTLMPIISKIQEQRRNPNRRNIHLDGVFAFGCNLNVVAKFRLREGMQLTPEQVDQVQQGEVRQECFDAAMRALESRLHSRAELKKKLMRKEWGVPVIDGVLDDLQRLGYVDDARFAKTKAMSAAQYKHHGRRRAFMELLRSGVKGEVADRALDEVYEKTDSVAVAKALAQKQAARLKRLDPMVARRRLVGMLQRRGFDYDAIKPVVDEVLGDARDE